MACSSSYSSLSSSSSEIRSVVFIPDSELVWVQAVVESTDEEDGRYIVDIHDPDYVTLYRGTAAPTKKTVYLKDLPSPYDSFPLQNNDVMHSKEGKDDMCDLNFLHEPSILDNIHRRFKIDLPYTYTGDICIAVNPYQWLPLYTEALQEEYIARFRHELRPHVYASSSSSYRGIRDYKKNQSILVSGESGAGKTETVKILMRHIAHIAGKKYDSTVDKVLKANPLLESFGNAKTTRNDNSSRFGKFTQLQFNEFAKLVGSKCVTYLLEKSRVVSQNQNERNYHIFHELFASPMELRKKIKLDELNITDFNYMKKGDTKTTIIEGRSDALRFEDTVETLHLLGVSEEDIKSVFEILAGILYLGQLTFIGENGDNDKSIVDPNCSSIVNTVGQLLKIDVDSFSKGITIRHIEVVGDEMEIPLNVDQANDVRDALAKEIYSRLFLWLVGVVNMSTASYGATTSTISLLDIFGFESFAVNRFEQLCINYANEKLQQKFTLDIFQAVQAEYKDEGLEWETIPYKDNADVLQLIEGKSGVVIGVMALLNEECLMPKGTDRNLLGKMRKVCNEHEAFSFRLSDAKSVDEFCITHYAGKVAYNINGFLERNKDTLANEARTVMFESKNMVLAEIFSRASYNTDNVDILGDKMNQYAKSEEDKGKFSRKASFLGADTVVTKFKGQLNSLMKVFGQTEVQYVRCIKPNAVKLKSLFDRRMVVEQLRCAGMIEAIRITRAAYPYRVSQETFISRFQGLRSKEWNHVHSADGMKAHCVALLSSILTTPEFQLSQSKEAKTYEVGKSKVYFSSAVLEFLEVVRGKQLYSVVELIQKGFRGSRVRKWFLRYKKAIVKVQSIGRMYAKRKKLKNIHNCIISLQCAFRSKRALRVAKYKLYLRSIAKIQASIRMFLARSRYCKIYNAASKIGAWIQMKLQVRAYKSMKSAQAERDSLTSKLAELKQKLKSDMTSRASSAVSDHNIIPEHGFFDGDDDDDEEEDITVLSALQEEMKKLRDTHERLLTENTNLKSEGRKEHFDLDNKIAQMSLGKTKILSLERERDELKSEHEKSELQLKHLKTEKQHVVDSLLHLSNEVDVVNRERRAWKKLYDTERAIRLSQMLREREIMVHLRHLLRRKGVDYQQINETKVNLYDTLYLAAADEHVVSLNSTQSHSDFTSSDSEDVMNHSTSNRYSPSPRFVTRRRGRYRFGQYQSMEGTENLSNVSFSSPHKSLRHAGGGSDDFADAHHSQDILTARSEKADKPFGALNREKEKEARNARQEKARRDRRWFKSRSATNTGKKSTERQTEESGAAYTFADWWEATFSPAPPK